MTEECILYARTCIDCGECDICDLDEDKICDDCGQCIADSGEYRTLDIQEYLIAQGEKERRKAKVYKKKD